MYMTKCFQYNGVTQICTNAMKTEPRSLNDSDNRRVENTHPIYLNDGDSCIYDEVVVIKA